MLRTRRSFLRSAAAVLLAASLAAPAVALAQQGAAPSATPRPAQAAPSGQLLGDARVPFSADRTLTVDGRTFSGRLYHTPGRQRHEQMLEGMQQVVILRADRAQGWLVVPSLKSYVEFVFPRAVAELSDPSLRGSPVGQETVNGVRTTKYRVEHSARDGTTADGYLWVSAEGIVMRLNGEVRGKGNGGKPTPFALELANVRLGAQDAGLFDLPPGYMKLPANALQPLLGGMAGGFTRG
jgi:hypothetical protein